MSLQVFLVSGILSFVISPSTPSFYWTVILWSRVWWSWLFQGVLVCFVVYEVLEDFEELAVELVEAVCPEVCVS